MYDIFFILATNIIKPKLLFWYFKSFLIWKPRHHHWTILTLVLLNNIKKVLNMMHSNFYTPKIDQQIVIREYTTSTGKLNIFDESETEMEPLDALPFSVFDLPLEMSPTLDCWNTLMWAVWRTSKYISK